MVKLKNDTYSIEFDNINYVLTEKDTGYPTLGPNTFQNIQQTGITWLGTGIYGRNVSIEGWILANSKQDMAQKRLRFFNITSPLNQYKLIIDNYMLILHTESISLSPKTLENNDKRLHFILYAVAADPCFHRINRTTIPIGAAEKKLIFPLHTPVVFGKLNSNIIQVNNDGISTGFHLKLTAYLPDGDMDGFRIVNEDDYDKLMRFDNTITNGDEIEINTMQGNKYVKLNGDSMLNNLHYMSQFLQLSSGVNNFRLQFFDNISYHDFRGTGQLDFDERVLEV